MEKTPALIDELIRAVGTLAEQPEVQALIEVVSQQQQQIEAQQQQIEAQQQQIEQLKEELRKLRHRSSHNSSVPPSQDLLKKTSRKESRKSGKKRGPKYDHPGKTRFGVWTGRANCQIGVRNLPGLRPGCEGGAGLRMPSASDNALTNIGPIGLPSSHILKSSRITMTPSVLCVQSSSIVRSVALPEAIGVRALVAQMFSFLETMRLQGTNAVEALFEQLSLASCSPPSLASP
jgi:DNA-binding protein H-NS